MGQTEIRVLFAAPAGCHGAMRLHLQEEVSRGKFRAALQLAPRVGARVRVCLAIMSVHVCPLQWLLWTAVEVFASCFHPPRMTRYTVGLMDRECCRS